LADEIALFVALPRKEMQERVLKSVLFKGINSLKKYP